MSLGIPPHLPAQQCHLRTSPRAVRGIHTMETGKHGQVGLCPQKASCQPLASTLCSSRQPLSQVPRAVIPGSWETSIGLFV